MQHRRGQLLDAKNNPVAQDDPKKWDKAVHLKDIHLERGMHCVDCHYTQDAHGNGKIYGDRRAAIEIACEDCHGTVDKKVTLQTLRTSGVGAPDGGNHLRIHLTVGVDLPDGGAQGLEIGARPWQPSSHHPAAPSAAPITV